MWLQIIHSDKTTGTVYGCNMSLSVIWGADFWFLLNTGALRVPVIVLLSGEEKKHNFLIRSRHDRRIKTMFKEYTRLDGVMSYAALHVCVLHYCYTWPVYDLIWSQIETISIELVNLWIPHFPPAWQQKSIHSAFKDLTSMEYDRSTKCIQYLPCAQVFV